MQERFIDKVFLSIDGQLLPEHTVPGVENIFAEGGIGNRLYAQIRDAYERICDRLGVQDEDADLNLIIDTMEAIDKEIAYRMYRYGALFGTREA